jgi:hypothetical protein
MLKKIILLAFLTSMTSTWASTQYVCEFGSQVAITNNDISKPQTKIINDSSRYTFLVARGKTKGSYINMSDGLAYPISVNIKAGIATFVETDGLDNGFIVSVFLSQGALNARPAIFSQHSYTVNSSQSEFFVPKTSLGTCRVTDVR